MSEGNARTSREYMKDFGLSADLSARLALLSRLGLSCTPALLLAGNHEPFILSVSLLKLAEKEDWEGVARAAAGLNPPLSLREDGQGRTLMLETEAGAEGPGSPSLPVPSKAAQPALRPLSPVVSDMLDDSVPRRLRESMLTLLASPDPLRRIEALRRVLLVGQDPMIRNAVLFHALRDADRGVAAEAVKALADLGLHGEASECLIELINAPPERAGEVIEGLKPRLGAFGMLETALIRAFVARLFGDEAFSESRGRLLEFYRLLIRRPGEARKEFPAFLKILLGRLPSRSGEAMRAALDLVMDMAELDPGSVPGFLWKRLDSAGSQEREFLVEALSRIRLPGRAGALLDRRIIETDISRHLDRGEDVTPWRARLVERWKSFASPLLDLAEAAEGERRAMLVKIAGEVVASCKAPARAAAALAARCLGVAESGSQADIRALMRSGLHARPGMGAALRSRFARLFVKILNTEFLPEYNAEIYEAMRSLGFAAAGPILDFIGVELRDTRQRLELVEILDGFLADAGVVAGVGKAEFRRFLIRLEALAGGANPVVANRVAAMAGTLILNPAAPAGAVELLSRRCLAKLKSRKYGPGDVAQAACIAESPAVHADLKKDLTRLLIKVLNADQKQAVAEEVKEADGTLLKALAGADVHTMLIPAALRGLAAAAASIGGEAPFPQMIARSLMRKFEETESMKTVWSLKNRRLVLDTLAGMLSSGAARETMKQEILVFLAKLFWKDPTEHSVVEVLSIALHQGAVEGSAALASGVGRRLLDVGMGASRLGPSETDPFLLAAARILAGPNSVASAGQEIGLCVDLLERRATQGSEKAIEALRLMLGGKTVPDALKARAEKILSRVPAPSGDRDMTDQ